MIVVPALPEPTGPNPSRVKFYAEVGAAFEFLALWHSLPVEGQEELRAAVQGAAARAAGEASAGKPPTEPENRPVARSRGPRGQS